METLTTPKIELLLSRLLVLNNELAKNMFTLVKRLHHLEEEEIVLSDARHNIVDRKKEKERHKKAWKVELKEKIDSAIEYESLDEI